MKLARFDGYKPRPEKPSGTAGARAAHVETITFSFIADANVRVLSLQQGEVHYVEEARTEASFEKRKALYARAQTMIMDEVPLIVFGNSPYIEAYARKLRGVEVRDPHFDYVWNVWLAR